MRIEARHAVLPRTDRVQIIVVRSRLGSLRAAGRHLGGCFHRNRAGGALWAVLRVFARARLLSGRASLQHCATPRAASRCSCFRKCATIKGPLRPVCVCGASLVVHRAKAALVKWRSANAPCCAICQLASRVCRRVHVLCGRTFGLFFAGSQLATTDQSRPKPTKTS